MLVVDASVAVLWTLDQPGSQRAAALRAEEGLIAPSLIVAEIGNAVWKAVRRGDLPSEHALTAVEIALGPLDELSPVEELHGRALELAIELQHPIYDCFYIALAERERVPLVCADKDVIKEAKRLKGLEIRALYG
jgi:predicted nucleic acid-binding protein